MVQDTTTLDYTAHPTTSEIGPINTKKDGTIGLRLHDTMAFTTKGSPLGLVDVQVGHEILMKLARRNYGRNYR